MKVIEHYIVQKQTKLAQHTFFQQLTEDTSLEQFASVASRLSFWVMSFQDLLRLNEERITNEQIRNIVGKHRLENMGHEQWFLQYVNQIKCKVLTLKSLYSRDHFTTRNATYTLMSEVFQTRNDYERVVLLLTLESANHVFFGSTVDFVESVSYSGILQYFSDYHLDLEKNHGIFEQTLEAYLESVQLTQEEEQNILNMIDRMYNAFTQMFDGLELTKETNHKLPKLPILALA